MSVRCSGMSFPQIAGIHVDLIKAKWIPAFAGMTPCDFSRYPEESHGYWAFRHARPRVRLDGPPGLPVTKRHRRPLATLKCNHRGDLIFQSWPISEFALSQSKRRVRTAHAAYAISTARTSSSTPSCARTAPNIAARLSMLGLPLSDNMRCKLLLGLSVSSAKRSKPRVAFTKSRRIRRAVSGSSLKKRVAASSSSAFANSGSR